MLESFSSMTLVLAFAVATPAGETPLPPPVPAPAPEPKKKCSTYSGTAAGNDAGVPLFLSLCGEETVAGRVFWVSKKSGVSVRAVSGTRAGNGDLDLKDDKLETSRPNPGWRFCLVDRYTLVRNGDRLEGQYVSQACNDRATISLVEQK